MHQMMRAIDLVLTERFVINLAREKKMPRLLGATMHKYGNFIYKNNFLPSEKSTLNKPPAHIELAYDVVPGHSYPAPSWLMLAISWS